MYTNVLFSAAGVTTPPVETVQPTASPERVEAFENALERQSASQVPSLGEAAAAAPIAPSEGARADLDAQSRARQGLDLDGAASVSPAEGGRGDMILNGIEKLRGVFDVREARIGELMNTQTTDANKLMAMQMEVVNFTLLVDMTSKLTGKSTAVFDTLMKGQ